MSKRTKFRVGQAVQSIYDATHTFVIDESVVPERIFHEKGSDRWWTRKELQRLGMPENPVMSSRLNGKNQMRGTHPPASQRHPAQMVSAMPPVLELKKRVCPECTAAFQATRPWQKFDKEACRRANWKRSSQTIEPVKGFQDLVNV